MCSVSPSSSQVTVCSPMWGCGPIIAGGSSGPVGAKWSRKHQAPIVRRARRGSARMTRVPDDVGDPARAGPRGPGSRRRVLVRAAGSRPSHSPVRSSVHLRRVRSGPSLRERALPSAPHDRYPPDATAESHAQRRHHRRRPGRAHRGLRARRALRHHVDDPRVRRHRRRHQPDRRARRLALRHRRPPLLHQGEGGRGVLARDPPRRGLHAAAAHEPHLLRGQVLRLPAEDPERAEEPRAVGGVPLRRVVPLGAHPPAEGPGHARRLDRGALRVAALRALLQDVQREALGRARRQAARPTSPRNASRTCRS